MKEEIWKTWERNGVMKERKDVNEKIVVNLNLIFKDLIKSNVKDLMNIFRLIFMTKELEKEAKYVYNNKITMKRRNSA